MPELNTPATAELTVAPFDGTTAATLELFAPDGTSTEPAASTADSGETWTADVTYDQQGWWLLHWTVTGTGAGPKYQRVFVPQPPAAGGPEAYVSLEVVKQALEIAPSVTLEDEYLTGRIRAASRAIDNHCHRRFWLDPELNTRVLNPAGRTWCDADGEHFMVADIGTLTGMVVEVGRAPNWVDITAEIEAEPTDALDRVPPSAVTSLLRVAARYAAPRVRVTARWGWPEVPEVVQEAALIQTLRLYKRKDSPEGILGSAEWDGGLRLSRVDPDVAALLKDYVLPGLG